MKFNVDKFDIGLLFLQGNLERFAACVNQNPTFCPSLLSNLSVHPMVATINYLNLRAVRCGMRKR